MEPKKEGDVLENPKDRENLLSLSEENIFEEAWSEFLEDMEKKGWLSHSEDSLPGSRRDI